jgi:hypothetical protein
MDGQERARNEAALCPTDDDAVTPRAASKKSKRSVDYVWRTGLAGGLAGCAVSSPLPVSLSAAAEQALPVLTQCNIGQIRRRAA